MKSDWGIFSLSIRYSTIFSLNIHTHFIHALINLNRYLPSHFVQISFKFFTEFFTEYTQFQHFRLFHLFVFSLQNDAMSFEPTVAFVKICSEFTFSSLETLAKSYRDP